MQQHVTTTCNGEEVECVHLDVDAEALGWGMDWKRSDGERMWEQRKWMSGMYNNCDSKTKPGIFKYHHYIIWNLF